MKFYYGREEENIGHRDKEKMTVPFFSRERKGKDFEWEKSLLLD